VSHPPYIVVGRSRDCDVVLEDASVSGRHARLAWKDGRILVEDLGSANGTWLAGDKIDRATVRPGDDVRLGNCTIPWSDARLRPFLRAGARGDTMVGTPLPGRRFICGACGSRGLMPDGFRRGALKCGSCGASLVVGRTRRGIRWVVAAAALSLLIVAGVGWAVTGSPAGVSLEGAAQRLGIRGGPDESARSPQEASIRAHTVPLVLGAIDSTHSITRNTAVRIAAEDQGPYHIEQVAKLWTHVRGRWRYVNDPRGGEYFATASETIDNGYAGDCDDFAIVLIAMITSIGGEARLVMMDGPNGGHAYAEACVRESPEESAKRLSRHYRRTWDQYLGRQRVEQIHFRSSQECPLWINLDWNAGVPGGPYGGETWAVSIYPDGRTETLAPSPGPGGSLTPAATGSGASQPPP
jgi:hypothetical protein